VAPRKPKLEIKKLSEGSYTFGRVLVKVASIANISSNTTEVYIAGGSFHGIPNSWFWEDFAHGCGLTQV
jgi:hypothetical protein